MLTLQKLKELKQTNREKPVIYKLLATIIGECEQVSKSPSNNEIIDILQKMYKDNNTTLKECSEDRIDQIQELNEENNFISQYLPVPLTNEELSALIGSQMSEGRRMPDIMKYLSANYKGRYDSKKALMIINSLL
jgi:uncharacterized protein YqeY